MCDAWLPQNAGTRCMVAPRCGGDRVWQANRARARARARVTVYAVGRTMFSLTEYMVQRVDGPFNIVIPTNKGRGRSFSKFPSEIHAGKSGVACSRIIELFSPCLSRGTARVCREFSLDYLAGKKILKSDGTFYVLCVRVYMRKKLTFSTGGWRNSIFVCKIDTKINLCLTQLMLGMGIESIYCWSKFEISGINSKFIIDFINGSSYVKKINRANTDISSPAFFPVCSADHGARGKIITSVSSTSPCRALNLRRCVIRGAYRLSSRHTCNQILARAQTSPIPRTRNPRDHVSAF